MIYDAEPEKSQAASDERERRKKTKEGQTREKDKAWPPPIQLRLVDFANCVTGEDPLPDSAPCPPAHPEDIDRGYLRGLRTLRMYFQRILKEVNDEEYVERGGGEGTREQVGVDNTSGWSESVMDDNGGEVSV